MNNQTSMQTFSGRYVDFLAPDPTTIEIEDIARALAKCCRFAGHLYWPYSVAQHCVHVCELVDPPYRLHALLHDAHEAYLGDMVRPLKLAVPEVNHIASLLDDAIFAKFRVSVTRESLAAVKRADDRMLSAEVRLLRPGGQQSAEDWGLPPPAFLSLNPWSWQSAMALFLSTFETVKGKGVASSESI